MLLRLQRAEVVVLLLRLQRAEGVVLLLLRLFEVDVVCGRVWGWGWAGGSLGCGGVSSVWCTFSRIMVVESILFPVGVCEVVRC